MKRIWDAMGISFLALLAFWGPSAKSQVPGNVFATANTANGEMSVSTAFDGASYLVTWTHSGTADLDIAGRFVDGRGTPLGSAHGIATSSGNQGLSPVVFGGGKYLVVWTDGIGFGSGEGVTAGDVLGAFIAPIAVTEDAPANAKYGGGTGEPNDPYQIATVADLIALGNEPNDYAKCFILTADIDLDPNLPGGKVFDRAVVAPDINDTESWYQGTPFAGVFDGNGHGISHLTINGQGFLGLFGRTAPGAAVKQLGIADANVTGSDRCIGGLVGWNWGTITRCYSNGVVLGWSSVGGLVGEAL